MSVQINGSDGVDSSGKLQSGGDPNDGTAVGAKILQSGLVQAARSSGSATSAVFMGFTEGTATATSRINANGSASFGGVLTGQSVVESTRFGESVQLGGASDGALVVGGSGADNKVKIGYDGTALFKSGEGTNVTAQSTNGNGGFLNFSGLDSSGNTTFSVNHNGTVFAAGGINFGTVTSPVTSKTLSDYEEGTWVPSVRNQAGQTVTGGLTTAGTYVKIGNLLYLSATVAITGSGNGYNDGSVTWNSGPTASSNLLVGNVPYAMSESFAEIFTFGTGINASPRRPMFGTKVITGARQGTSTSITFFHVADSNTETGLSMFLTVSDWIGNKFNFACCLKLPA